MFSNNQNSQVNVFSLPQYDAESVPSNAHSINNMQSSEPSAKEAKNISYFDISARNTSNAPQYGMSLQNLRSPHFKPMNTGQTKIGYLGSSNKQFNQFPQSNQPFMQVQQASSAQNQGQSSQQTPPMYGQIDQSSITSATSPSTLHHHHHVQPQNDLQLPSPLSFPSGRSMEGTQSSNSNTASSGANGISSMPLYIDNSNSQSETPSTSQPSQFNMSISPSQNSPPLTSSIQRIYNSNVNISSDSTGSSTNLSNQRAFGSPLIGSSPDLLHKRRKNVEETGRDAFNLEQKKMMHKEVERRRREAINDGISALASIVPNCEKAKTSVLKRTYEYVCELQQRLSLLNELMTINDTLQKECQRAWAEADAWKSSAESLNRSSKQSN